MRFVFLAATFLGACGLSVVAVVAQSGWVEVKNSKGEMKAAIELIAMIRDQHGIAHARVCVIENGGCRSGQEPVWIFNCRDHSYSWTDTTVVPTVTHDMVKSEPDSVEAQLLAIACK
jgi:hypothetical protein